MESYQHFLRALGERIRSYRLASNLTQVAFSARLDIDDRYLRRIEKGERFPSMQLLIRLAIELNIQVEDIVKGISHERGSKQVENDRQEHSKSKWSQ